MLFWINQSDCKLIAAFFFAITSLCTDTLKKLVRNFAMQWPNFFRAAQYLSHTWKLQTPLTPCHNLEKRCKRLWADKIIIRQGPGSFMHWETSSLLSCAITPSPQFDTYNLQQTGSILTNILFFASSQHMKPSLCNSLSRLLFQTQIGFTDSQVAMLRHSLLAKILLNNTSQSQNEFC